MIIIYSRDGGCPSHCMKVKNKKKGSPLRLFDAHLLEYLSRLSLRLLLPPPPPSHPTSFFLFPTLARSMDTLSFVFGLTVTSSRRGLWSCLCWSTLVNKPVVTGARRVGPLIPLLRWRSCRIDGLVVGLSPLSSVSKSSRLRGSWCFFFHPGGGVVGGKHFKCIRTATILAKDKTQLAAKGAKQWARTSPPVCVTQW